MIVLVPYVASMLHPDTTRLLEEHVPAGVEVVWREIDPDDRTAYSRLLVEAWTWPFDLVVIEHDIGITAGVIEGFRECRQPWCGHPYPIGAQLLVALGCTRFTAGLKTALPNLMAEAAQVGDAQDGGLLPAGVWQRLDVRIGSLLEAHGHHRHQHHPPVQHFHHYPPGG